MLGEIQKSFLKAVTWRLTVKELTLVALASDSLGLCLSSVSVLLSPL